MSVGSGRQLVKLRLVRNGDYVKCDWHLPTVEGADTYELDPKTLVFWSKELRGALYELLEVVREDGLDKCGPVLRDVATLGNKLFRRLFDPADDAGSRAANEIREWIESQSDQIQIVVVDETDTHVPWGLCYGASPNHEVEHIEIGHYTEFWCIKYELATVHKILLGSVETEVSDSHLEIISTVSKSVWRRVRAQLSETEREYYLWLKGNSAASILELSDKFAASRSHHTILYFLCHSRGDGIEITDGEFVPVPELEDALTRRGDGGLGTILFLNGCRTAVGSNIACFLSIVRRVGYFGYIGTETRIPDLFASRFGYEFFHYFCRSGWRLNKVMNHLRKKHWPLSLLYGLYCHPDVHLRTEGTEPLHTPSENLSTCDLGTVIN